MYEKYLVQLEEAGKIRNLKERSIRCYKNYVSYFLNYVGKNPQEFTCQDVRVFLLKKKDEGLKTTTLNPYNSAIHFFTGTCCISFGMIRLFPHNQGAQASGCTVFETD